MDHHRHANLVADFRFKMVADFADPIIFQGKQNNTKIK